MSILGEFFSPKNIDFVITRAHAHMHTHTHTLLLKYTDASLQMAAFARYRMGETTDHDARLFAGFCLCVGLVKKTDDLLFSLSTEITHGGSAVAAVSKPITVPTEIAKTTLLV